jgi:hypothetical protein
MKKLLKRFLCYPFCCFLHKSSYAQGNTLILPISGSVYDKDKPLPGVILAVHTPSGSRYTATTDYG